MEQLKISGWLAFRHFPPYIKRPFKECHNLEEMLLEHVPQDAGILLSSGRDSALLASFLPKGSYAYTAKFKEVADETKEAKRIAKKLGLIHREVLITKKDYTNSTPVLIKHKGEPITGQEPAIYTMALRAKKDGVKNLLMGCQDGSFGMTPLNEMALDPTILGYPPVDELTKGFTEEEISFHICYGSWEAHTNAVRCAGLNPVTPYHGYGNYIRWKHIYEGEYKQPVADLYRKRFGEEPNKKIPFRRPLAEYLKDFNHNYPIRNNGSTKWLIYSLKQYESIYNSSR